MRYIIVAVTFLAIGGIVLASHWQPSICVPSGPFQPAETPKTLVDSLNAVAKALATPPDPVPVPDPEQSPCFWWMWRIYPWQTLIAGFLAFFGGLAAYAAVKAQIGAEKRRAREDEKNRIIGLALLLGTEMLRLRATMYRTERRVSAMYTLIPSGINAMHANRIRLELEKIRPDSPRFFELGPNDFRILGESIGRSLYAASHRVRGINILIDRIIVELSNDEPDVDDLFKELIQEISYVKSKANNLKKRLDKMAASTTSVLDR